MIGDRIKKTRELRSIGQTELADMVGISKQTLYKYEKNIVTNIPSDIIEKLATVLRTTPQYLMGWSEPDVMAKLTDLAEERYIMEIMLPIMKGMSEEQIRRIESYAKFIKENE